MSAWSGRSKFISRGNYHADRAFEEGTVSNAFYASQAALPRLPVCDLDTALDLYLRTVRPLATSQELATTEAAVAAFRAGLGPVLVGRLQAKARANPDSSWLQHWWNQYGYLQVRDPSPINVSYFFQFADDPGLSAPTSAPVTLREAHGLQALAGARLLTAVVDVRDELVAGTLKPEGAGAALCAAQWKYVFNACRVPMEGEDEVHVYNPELPGSQSVLVLRRNKHYTVPLRDGGGRRFSTAELYAALQTVLLLAGDHDDVNVGALTSDDRDHWAAARVQLVADGNAHALEQIQQPVVALCLDGPDYAPSDNEGVARQLWHGAPARANNRWWDKSLQFVVLENGKTGVVGEHSLFDGAPTLTLCDRVLKALRGNSIPSGREVLASGAAGPSPTQISFRLSAASCAMIDGACERLDALVARHDLKVLSFTGFGKDVIKKLKCGPDAFAQMAIQLAYFKQFGCQRATYESSATRGFLHGRTETTRSVSSESAAFVQAMQDPLVGAQQKHVLLQKAVAAHTQYTRLGAKGEGCDRLLLGLKLLLQPGEAAALYDDPLYARSKHWCVSTSHLTHELFAGWGWGEVVPDGVGVAYSIKNHSMHFNVTCCRKAEGWSPALCHFIQEALLEMRSVCEAAAAAPKARL